MSEKTEKNVSQTPFSAALAVRIPHEYVKTVEDRSYLPWATALQLAGRPKQKIVLFGQRPDLQIFGGSVVAVDMQVGEKMQRTYLPVLDNRNQPIPMASVTARDVGDALSRCRPKAVAMVCGNGLSLYAGYGPDGAKFLKELAVTADCDPSQVPPLRAIKKSRPNAEGVSREVPYLDWAVALAAARLSDTNFFWEVMEFDVTEADSGEIQKKLYTEVNDGYMVAVRIEWRGIEHIEFLPIMSGNNQAIAAPTAADWNKSVMRCLAKAIAILTGYGLSLYSKEDLTVIATQLAPVSDVEREKLVKDLNELLKHGNKSQEDLVKWLGYPLGTKVEDLPAEALRRSLQVMKPKAAA